MQTSLLRHRISHLRQRLMNLKDMPVRLLPIFLEGYPMVKGNVYTLKRKCGKAKCRCARGKLHKMTVLTASVLGKTRLWTIPADRVEELTILTRRYQRFRTARANFVKLYTKMLRIIDAIEQVRRQEI